MIGRPPIPRSILPIRNVQARYDHFQLAVDKINRRMNLEKDSEDFISDVIKLNEDFKNINLEKVQTTFAILIIVCSETTVTVLSAMISYLVQNPSKPQKLTSEIRSTLTIKRVNNHDLILTYWLNEEMCKCS